MDFLNDDSAFSQNRNVLEFIKANDAMFEIHFCKYDELAKSNSKTALQRHLYDIRSYFCKNGILMQFPNSFSKLLRMEINMTNWQNLLPRRS